MDQGERVAFVTGASRGIGRATAKALAVDGYRVILHYGANREMAEDAAREIRDVGGTADIVGADLADPDAAKRLACEVKAICGGALHALVLNAGIMAGSKIKDCPEDLLDELYTVNLLAPFLLFQHLAPVLVDHASVVIVSSLSAHRVLGAVSGYSAVKAGLEALVGRGVKEFGPRWIRVNGVAPGTIANDHFAAYDGTEQGRNMTLGMQALQRIGQPEDVADVIAFLCSDKARWIDGAVIPVDGGSLF
ncbi:MAG: SDR family oxidoreductase [Novosphingobium sp.]|nr:SDR family oxidoreductase [Novosphingobium sp.]